MRGYKMELTCPGCEQVNVVEVRQLSYVLFKPVIYDCALCESRVFMSVRRKPHESNRQLEMRLVRFNPSPEYIEALKNDIEEEVKGDTNEAIVTDPVTDGLRTESELKDG